jgi:flagellar M-ring protein FliF
MDQLKRILASLSVRQRILIAAVVLLLGGGLFWFARNRADADYKPLVTGLAPEDAAAVVQKLKEASVDYRLSDTGGVISVPSAKIAELRLELAAAGLPKTGRIGYEIFDKSNLGATDFVEHVNYRRALEGELERSLASMAGVEQARVHLTFAKDSVFLDSREPAKASVMLKLKPETRLSQRNVIAVGRLVANAVEGLSPDAVSVVDMQGNLLSKASQSPEDEATDHSLEYRQKIERALLQKVNDTLEPLLGHDHFRAGVTADVELNSGEQSEETLDPSRSVMVSSAKTEEVSNGLLSGGVPGTASNLPRPVTRPSGYGSTSSRRTENVNYESSRLVRKMKMPQGSVKRVSVAVLLDQKLRWEGAGANAKQVLDPPSPETLKAVKDVVAGVVGFSQERGDQITVESLPFENTLKLLPPPAPPAAPGAPAAPGTPGATGNTAPQGTPAWKNWTWLKNQNWKDWKHNRMLIVASATGGALLLAAGVLIFLRKRKKKIAAELEAAKALEAANTPPALTAAEQLQQQLAERESAQEEADRALLASIKIPPIKTQKAEVLVKQLRENAQKDAKASVQVLQAWIHGKV